jgi:hypothetical protein
MKAHQQTLTHPSLECTTSSLLGDYTRLPVATRVAKRDNLKSDVSLYDRPALLSPSEIVAILLLIRSLPHPTDLLVSVRLPLPVLTGTLASHGELVP